MRYERIKAQNLSLARDFVLFLFYEEKARKNSLPHILYRDCSLFGRQKKRGNPDEEIDGGGAFWRTVLGT